MKCKGKGPAYEREICRALSLWVSHGERKDVFWRSAMSGGRARVHGKHGDTQFGEIGDITAVHPCGNWLIDRFVIECKHGNRDYLQLDNLVWGKRAPVIRMWEKVWRDAATRSKEPMLCVRQNGKPDLVFLTRAGTFCLAPTLQLKIVARFPQKNVVVFLLKDFLNVKCPAKG